MNDWLPKIEQAPPRPAVHLLLTSQEAAQALAISPRKLWSLTNDGEIRCVRIGRAVRYDVNDLSHWIERQKGGVDG